MSPVKSDIVKSIFILFLLAAAGAGLYLYASGSPLIDPILPQKAKIMRAYRRLVKMFPEKLGDYELYAQDQDKIQVKSECERIEEHPDSKETGLTGQVCGWTIEGQYREGEGGRVVTVHLSTYTEGNEVSKQLLSLSAKKEKLNGKDIMRIERHEIGWYPAYDFDIITIQEGKWKTGKNGSVNISFLEQATGKNPVTQFFLDNYSPIAQQ